MMNLKTLHQLICMQCFYYIPKPEISFMILQKQTPFYKIFFSSAKQLHIRSAAVRSCSPESGF